jgi:hypothetical protein
MRWFAQFWRENRTGVLNAAPLLALTLAFGPSLVEHMRRASNPYVFTDDARQQIWPLFKYYDPTIGADYIGDYYLRAIFPIGWRAVFSGLACLADPDLTSRTFTYVALAAFVGAITWAAWRLAGPFGGYTAAALALSSGLPLERVAGGLPRSFGFPVLGVAVAGLASGNAYVLAAAVILGAAFYPAVAVGSGLALFCQLIVLPARYRGSAAEWPLRRRLAVVAGTAALSILLLVPAAVGARAYGHLVTPREVASYPEAGPGGRHTAENRVPSPPAILYVAKFLKRPLVSNGPPFSPIRRELELRGAMTLAASIVLLVAVSGLFLAYSRSESLRPPLVRLAVLGAIAPCCYALAGVAAPYLYLPERHVVFILPTLAFVLVPVGLAHWGRLLARGRRVWETAIPVVLAALVLATLGGRVATTSGLTVDAGNSAHLYAFLDGLGDGVRIAGWPGDEIDSEPLVSRKPVLMTFEMHVPFHTAYLDEMRARMRALTAAMFATDAAPLLRLRDEFGVTHLVARKEYFGAAPPTYFAPFTQEVVEAESTGAARGCLVPRLPTVFDDGRVFVVDLRALN